MIREDQGREAPNWLDNILRGAISPEPPSLDSSRVKELAKRGLLIPGSMTKAEIQELSAAIISHLVAQKS